MLDWRPKAKKAFQNLKIAFMITAILIHFNFSNPFYIEIDAPDSRGVHSMSI